MFSVVIHITPRPAPRIRISRRGGRYYEDWYNAYKNQIAAEVDKYVLGNLFNEKLALELIFYKNRPLTADDYGDCDNLAKGVMDALTGHLYKDDLQVKELYVSKNTDEEERIVINCVAIQE